MRTHTPGHLTLYVSSMRSEIMRLEHVNRGETWRLQWRSHRDLGNLPLLCEVTSPGRSRSCIDSFYSTETVLAMSEGEEDPPTMETREQSYPLNSRRLTASIIGRITSALEVPTGGSLEDTRQMLEGKLVEAGREPRNVQVVLVGADDGATVRLEDDGGMFLELMPAGPDADAAERDGGGSRESDEADGDSDHACASELREEIRRANEQIRALKEEVSSVRGELESERERGKEELARERENLANARAKYKELWSIYCARSARDDALIASKEKELEDLRNRLAEHEHHSTSTVTPLPRELGHDSPSPRVDLGPTREPSPCTHKLALQSGEGTTHGYLQR